MLQVGKPEDAIELCRELNELLGRDEFDWYDNSDSLGISANNLTDEEVEQLNLAEDFIIN